MGGRVWHVRHVEHAIWDCWRRAESPFPEEKVLFISIVQCDRCDACDMLNRQSELAGEMRVPSSPPIVFLLFQKGHLTCHTCLTCHKESCVLPRQYSFSRFKRSFNMSHMSHMSQRELRRSPPIFFLSFQKCYLTCHTCLTCHKESCVLPPNSVSLI